MERRLPHKHPGLYARLLLAAIILLLAGGLLLVLFQPASDRQPVAVIAPSANLMALAPAAFFAGVLSFLSPCTLPILPAYFAFTFGTASGAVSRQQGRGKVLLASLSFFAGLATTMILLGASFTAIGQLVGAHRGSLTRLGGLVIMAFGLLSIAGKGFSGPRMTHTRRVTIAGAYLYGLTFAFGWSACIGPVLGSILTLLLTQGASLLMGAVLSFTYVLGLALPLIVVAIWFSRLGQGSRAWRILRGRAWTIRAAGRTLYLHSTSVMSGLLMLGIGSLLLSDALSSLNQYAASGPGEWALRLEEQVLRLFNLW